MKMKSAYESNPALGDPMTIEGKLKKKKKRYNYISFVVMYAGQLNECSHKLEKLRTDLKRYITLYEEAVRYSQTNNSQTNSPKLQNGSKRRNSNGSGIEEDSLSRSASDSSVTNSTVNHNKQSSPNTPQLNHG